MKLAKRMQCLLDEIDGEIVADIGCDHGKLICSALLCGKAQKGYAVDISEESLEKAKKLACKEGIDAIEFFVGDGQLPLLQKKIDTVVIAGMGANETVHILAQGKLAEKYVLSPHQDVFILRKYLEENGFSVQKDYVLFDKKYYSVLVVCAGKTDYTDSYYIGKNLPTTEDFQKYILLRKKTLETIEKDTNGNMNENSKKELIEIRKWLQSNKLSTP